MDWYVDMEHCMCVHTHYVCVTNNPQFIGITEKPWLYQEVAT